MLKKRNTRWDRHAIKAAVHRKNKSLTDLAKDNGLEETACRVALNRRHEAGEKAIAIFLGKNPAELWPARYPSSSKASFSRSKPESAVAASPIRRVA